MKGGSITMIRDEIAMILDRIVAIQKASVQDEIEEKFCDHGFLEETKCAEEINTRPIVIYTDDDKPWTCSISREDGDCYGCCTSCVFRVERVSNGVVTLRALKESCCRDRRFESTNSFITIRLHNIAAIRCLRDTFVNLCIR